MSIGERTHDEPGVGERRVTLRACKATSKGGLPCRAPVLRGADFCLAHHPDLAERRKAMRSRGGSVTTNRRKLLLAKVDFRDPRGVTAFIEALTSAVLLNQIPLSAAETCAKLAGEAARLRSAVETDERLAGIEAMLRELESEHGSTD